MCQPHVGARGKVRGLPKSLRFIVWESWISYKTLDQPKKYMCNVTSFVIVLSFLCLVHFAQFLCYFVYSPSPLVPCVFPTCMITCPALISFTCPLLITHLCVFGLVYCIYCFLFSFYISLCLYRPYFISRLV